MSTRPQTPPPGEPTAALARLHEKGAQWRSAAEQAFAGVAHSPERYVAAGRYVAAWLEQLRALPPGQGTDVDDDETGEAAAASAMLDAWEARGSAAPATGAGLPLTADERATLTASAFAIRYAEVSSWLTARRRRRAMAAATAAGGQGWLVLDEAGDPNGDPFIPYRRLEADPVTGRGVLVSTRPDDRFVGIIHEVSIVHIDPATGALEIDERSQSWEFSSRGERENLVESLRSDEPHGSE